MDVNFVFPHQLFRETKHLSQENKTFLIEESLFFRKFPFHKKKLILLRASLKKYQSNLEDQGFQTEYIDTIRFPKLKNVFEYLVTQQGVKKIHYADTVDFLLERRLQRYSDEFQVQLVQSKSPNFVMDQEEFDELHRSKKSYFLAKFYEYQRKKYKILVENNQPIGGKWSFDEDNRKKLPKSVSIPTDPKSFDENPFIQEAKEYVEKHFSENPGATNHFIYPTDFNSAESFLEDFLERKFMHYGDYQDAITTRGTYLFHSLLSSSINIGLLDPLQVIQKALEFAENNPVSMNSLEGFIRQVLGWREFVKGVYVSEHVKQRTTNFFGFKNKLPASFWKGTTGIDPVDHSINNVLSSAYNHHIERLMILGNFMLLLEIDPDEVYHWFMSFYIDAYDWVMVPNVYGMSQYADGGLMVTKPYISGSNYVKKMSDHKKGEWCEVWDALYWCFIGDHLELFAKNHRMSMMVNLWNKKGVDQKREYFRIKDDFLNQLL